jgi:hypothetical protein
MTKTEFESLPFVGYRDIMAFLGIGHTKACEIVNAAREHFGGSLTFFSDKCSTESAIKAIEFNGKICPRKSAQKANSSCVSTGEKKEGNA